MQKKKEDSSGVGRRERCVSEDSESAGGDRNVESLPPQPGINLIWKVLEINYRSLRGNYPPL